MWGKIAGLASWLAITLLATWAVVLGFLIFIWWRVDSCQEEYATVARDCAGDQLGAAILLGVWGGLGMLVIPAGMLGASVLIYRWLQKRRVQAAPPIGRV
jgi:hypothetical protein